MVVDLESMYPDGDDTTGNEYCVEELRARYRGWLNRDWRKPRAHVSKSKQSAKVSPPEETFIETKEPARIEIFEDPEPSKPPPKKMPIFADPESMKPPPKKMSIFADAETSKPPSKKMSIFEDVETSRAPVKIPIFDDENTPQPRPDGAKRKARREEKANRTRKLEILEVKAEPQTSKFCVPLPSNSQADYDSSNKSRFAIRPKEIETDQVCRADHDHQHQGSNERGVRFVQPNTHRCLESTI